MIITAAAAARAITAKIAGSARLVSSPVCTADAVSFPLSVDGLSAEGLSVPGSPVPGSPVPGSPVPSSSCCLSRSATACASSSRAVCIWAGVAALLLRTDFAAAI